jgi:hypothetical protein
MQETLQRTGAGRPQTEEPGEAREQARLLAEMTAEARRSERIGRGLRDVAGGAVLIGIGLLMGGSVFTGDPTVLDWFFDLLGSFWVLKGVYLLVTRGE